MMGQRTYWHLQSLGRRPSDYDIATSRLLYYPGRGFEVATPIQGWYERHQQGSPLRAHDWERFADPRATTYSRYVAIQKDQEVFVDGLLTSVAETGYDRRLPVAWLDVLEQIIPTLRYPVHGLQMVAAYVGHMGPAGRIAVAGLMQASDEIRRIQGLARRMRQLQDTRAGFGEASKAVWQDDPRWQPLRRCIETLLVTYDWGEAFVALNLVCKPMFDAMFMHHFARLAEDSGDEVLGALLCSLAQDCRWHREWSAALCRMACDDEPGNREVIATWIDRWRAPAAAAVEPFAALFHGRPEGREGRAVVHDIDAAAASLWRDAGLGTTGGMDR